MARRRSTGVTWAIGALGVVAAWLPYPVFAPLGFVTWLPFGVWTLARAGWLGLALSAALTPDVLAPTAGMTAGLVDYARGAAELRSVGMPGAEFFNLDPALRIRRRTSGCVVTGGEFLFDAPYNLVVTGLIRRVGPMRGAWTGAYPTRDEAWAAATADGAVRDGVRMQLVQGGAEVRVSVVATGEEIARYVR